MVWFGLRATQRITYINTHMSLFWLNCSLRLQRFSYTPRAFSQTRKRLAAARGLQPAMPAVDVADVLCVRTHPRAAWIPIPTTKRGTSKCVTLCSSKSHWAIRALTGLNKDRDQCGTMVALKAFENDVRAQLGEPTPAQDSEPPSKKSRIHDTDSEAEDDSQQSSSSSTRKKIRLQCVAWTRLGS